MVTPPRERVDYESTPLTRQEYITAMVHLYRGELYRATVWRIRLDTTTNWAVLTTAGLLAFSFRGETNASSHWYLLVGFLLVGLLLGLEARRYQVLDVWRARLRRIEANFYGPILSRDPVSAQPDWGAHVAEDLLRPRFKITLLGAVRARLLRNYWAIFAVLLLSWGLKVLTVPATVRTWAEVRMHLQTGLMPWWAGPVYLAAFAGVLVAIALLAPRVPAGNDEFWRPDRTVAGQTDYDV